MQRTTPLDAPAPGAHVTVTRREDTPYRDRDGRLRYTSRWITISGVVVSTWITNPEASEPFRRCGIATPDGYVVGRLTEL